jgi:hypothetical protein
MKLPSPATPERQKIHRHIVSVAAKNASDFQQQCLLFSFSIKPRALAECVVAIESKGLLQISRESEYPVRRRTPRYHLLTTTSIGPTRPPHAYLPHLRPPPTATVARPALPSRSSALLYYIPDIALLAGGSYRVDEID